MPGIIKYRGCTLRRMAWAQQGRERRRPRPRNTEKPHGRWRQVERQRRMERDWRVRENERNKREDGFKDTQREMRPEWTHRQK